MQRLTRIVFIIVFTLKMKMTKKITFFQLQIALTQQEFNQCEKFFLDYYVKITSSEDKVKILKKNVLKESKTLYFKSTFYIIY